MAKVDEDGYFFIVDRKKELIIRGGYNVYPREIEEVLYEHEGVLEAAVVGVPDDVDGRGGRRRRRPQGGPGRQRRRPQGLRQGAGRRTTSTRARSGSSTSCPRARRARSSSARSRCPRRPSRPDGGGRRQPRRAPRPTPAAGRPAAGSRAWRARSSPPAWRRGRGRSRAAAPGYGGELAKIAIGQSDVAPSKKDRRFKDEAWRGNPAFRRLAQAYLAAGKTVDDLICDAGLDERSERRVRFSAENVLDALAPTNFPALNPAALKATLDTGGRNLVQGTANLVHDLSRPPHIPAMVDEKAFTVGEDLARHARRGRAADRAVRADPVRAEHREGARDAAAARPADDQQVLHRRRRARAQHARVLRRRGPAVLHDLLAQPGRAPRRLGPGRLRHRRARGARRRSRRSRAPSART